MKNSGLTTEPFWRIGLYIRLSKEDERDGDSGSVINQEKILRGFVSEYFDAEEYVIVGVFSDDGLTGTDTFRPEFRRLRDLIARREINCMVIKSLARGFRNLADQQKFLEEFLPVYGARFISIGSPFIDTFKNPRAVSGFEVPIHGLFNEQFAAATSEEVRKTFNMKRERGEFIGAFAPYGYQKDPSDKSKLIIDEDAARVVRCIFCWYVSEGYSKSGIVGRLNNLGEPNPALYKQKKGLRYQNPNSSSNDGLWSGSTVAKILQNAVYTGAMVQGRHRVISYKIHKQIRAPQSEWFVVPDTHEAIIDRETFEKVQSLSRRGARTPPGKGTVHMLSGLVRCADCKKAMHRKTARGIAYYFCRTFTEKNACSKHSIRQDRLEALLLKLVREQIALEGDLSEEIEQIKNAPSLEFERERIVWSLQRAEKQLARIRDASDGLYTDWKSGEITRDEYHRLKSRFAGQMMQIESHIANIKVEIAKGGGAESEAPYLLSFIKNRNIMALNRGILIELIDTVWVCEGGEVVVDFRFAEE